MSANQCDGCRRGLPLKDGTHTNPDGSYDAIGCTKHLYELAPGRVEDVWGEPVSGGRWFKHGPECRTACDYDCGGAWVEKPVCWACNGGKVVCNRPCPECQPEKDEPNRCFCNQRKRNEACSCCAMRQGERCFESAAHPHANQPNPESSTCSCDQRGRNVSCPRCKP